MKKRVMGRLALTLLVAITVAACGQKSDTSAADKAKADVQAKAVADVAAANAAKEKEGLEAGVEAVAYGFPLVIMDATWK